MQMEPVLQNRIIYPVLLHDQVMCAIMTNQLNLHNANIFMSYGIPKGITQISSYSSILKRHCTYIQQQ